MSEEEIGAALRAWSNIFHKHTIVSDFFRDVGWGFIKLLVRLESAVDNSTSEMLKLLNLYNYKPIQDFLTEYQPIFYTIAVVFVVAAVVSMMKSKSAEFERFVGNMLVVGAMFVVFPTVLSTSTNVTTNLSNYVKDSGNATTTIVRSNLSDLLYIGRQYNFNTTNFNDGKVDPNAAITKKATPKAKDGTDSLKNVFEGNAVDDDTLNTIVVNETVDVTKGIFESESEAEKGLSAEAKKLLSHQIYTYPAKEGGQVVSAIKIHEYKLTPFLTEYYYRYDVNFGTILFYLILKLIVVFILAMKLAQLCYEILFISISATPVAMYDIKSGKRFWELANKFFATLAAVVMTFITQVIFNNAFVFIDNTWTMDLDTNVTYFVINIVAKLALTMFVIDGPNFFQSIFGVDAGLSSATRSLVGLNQGRQLLGSALSAPFKAASAGVKGAKKVGGAVFGTGENGSTTPPLSDALGGKDTSLGLDDTSKQGQDEQNGTTGVDELSTTTDQVLGTQGENDQAYGVGESDSEATLDTPTLNTPESSSEPDSDQTVGVDEALLNSPHATQASSNYKTWDAYQADKRSAERKAKQTGGKAILGTDGSWQVQPKQTSGQASANNSDKLGTSMAQAEKVAKSIGGQAVKANDGTYQVQSRAGVQPIHPNQIGADSKSSAMQAAKAVGGKAVLGTDGSYQVQPKGGGSPMPASAVLGSTKQEARQAARAIGGKAVQASDNSWQVQPQKPNAVPFHPSQVAGGTQLQAEKAAKAIGGTAIQAKDGSYQVQPRGGAPVHPKQALSMSSQKQSESAAPTRQMTPVSRRTQSTPNQTTKVKLGSSPVAPPIKPSVTPRQLDVDMTSLFDNVAPVVEPNYGPDTFSPPPPPRVERKPNNAPQDT